MMLVPSRAGGGEAPGSPRVLRALAALGRSAGRRGAPRDLERRIAAAGRPGGFGPRELMAAKLAGALVSGLVGAPLSAAMPGRLGLLAMVAAPVAGFLAPASTVTRSRSSSAGSCRRTA